MWAQALAGAIGIWLMAAPGVFGYEPPAENSDRIVGPVAATFGIVAMWEITRACRWVNLPLGAWLVLAPWLLWYETFTPMLNSSVAGVVLMITAFVRGKRPTPYGGGWRALFRTSELADRP